MKVILFITICSLFSFQSIGQHDHQKPVETNQTQAKPKSPKMAAMEYIGTNHVHIDYGSPSVRGRMIWNGLVAYDQVWATGAHNATTVDFGEDVIIAGKTFPKGKYGFFTIPNKDTWTLILSKTWQMHLADEYLPENDMLRMVVTPVVNKEITEALTYEVIPQTENKGTIKMTWEYLSVSFDFENM